MFLRFWRNSFYRFFGLAILLYLVWFVCYEVILHPLQSADIWVVNLIVHHTELILKGLGFDILSQNNNFRLVGIKDSSGVLIGDPCNGLSLFALFTGFVLAYPGAISRKIWFIPLGIILIHLLNVIRVASLALLAFYAPDKLEFNHTYTFTILVYSAVFLLWYVWANKLSSVATKA
jgi:exosortase family protein XrtF